MADIVYTTVNLPPAFVGVPYEAAIAYKSAATVFTAQSISAGALPTGLSLDTVSSPGSLRITGTPTAPQVSANLTANIGTLLAQVPAQPAVPATLVPTYNNNGFPVTVTLTGGTITALQVVGNTGVVGPSQGIVGPITLRPNEGIIMTFSSAPTWTWVNASPAVKTTVGDNTTGGQPGALNIEGAQSLQVYTFTVSGTDTAGAVTKQYTIKVYGSAADFIYDAAVQSPTMLALARGLN